MTDDLLRQVALAADHAWNSQASAFRSAARAILLLLAWLLAIGSRIALAIGNYMREEAPCTNEDTPIQSISTSWESQ
jgi:hypothetical protein